MTYAMFDLFVVQKSAKVIWVHWNHGIVEMIQAARSMLLKNGYNSYDG